MFSIVFVGQGVGNIIGSAVGGLVFDRLSYEPQMAILSFIAAISSVAQPWTGSVFGLAVCRLIASFNVGYIEPG